MGLLRKGRRERSGWDEDQVAATWQVASVLMDYPDEDQPVEALRAVLPGLPATARAGLGAFLDHREATDLGALQAEYVETFDTRRRCCLFLTYFLHGDTRKRGMALLRFKQTYLDAGLALRDEELPDHLCVVLEYGASIDVEGARRLLQDHRAGLELLRLALGDLDSPWAPVMEAVSATLPPLEGEEREAVRRLAAAGPPEEEVGLTPYSMPEVGTTSGPVDLPMPTLPVRKGA